eukprot:8484601-Lingulodinium_polyedra.AAC.1
MKEWRRNCGVWRPTSAASLAATPHGPNPGPLGGRQLHCGRAGIDPNMAGIVATCSRGPRPALWSRRP